jgi:hypothetical protein
MGSLSNLYISQSYQSLTHFANNSSASTSLVELEDGVGNGLGISLNTLGDLDIERQLIVHNGAEITGAVDINTTFSGSTQAFVNQSSTNNLIRITGSYTPTGNQASITEIGIGWLVNGGAVSNARVINVSGTPNSDVTYTIDQFYTANNVSYTFTGSIQREGEIEGDLNVSDDLFVGGHLIIEDGVEITGSIDITGDVTASNAWIQGDLVVSGTINAYEIITTIESSSVIFSSGSNILGDSTSDTQTLNGTIIMSGSSSLTGSMGITGDLNVLGNISSSTISGIGNVTTFSQSLDARLDFLEGPFSTSVDLRLDQLESFSSSLVTDFVNTIEFNSYTQSTSNLINTKLNTSSFNAYTQSINQTLTTFPTTGSNTFTGNQVFSGSIRGQVTAITINSNTASMNCSLGNFFTLSLPSGTTRLEATNILPGETISLRILNQSTTGFLSSSANIKYPLGFTYTPTPASNSEDILSFISFDTTSLYAVSVKNLS